MLYHILISAIVLVLTISVDAEEMPRDYEAQVQEILARVPSYSDEMEDWLEALGEPGVPAMCAALDTYRSPTTIVRALERIGSPKATDTLLNCLSEPASERYPRPIYYLVLEALKACDDGRADPVLWEIMNDESVFRSMRVIVAGAVARLGTEPHKAVARAFIMNAWHGKDGHPALSERRFQSTAIVIALCEVGTQEAFDILLPVLTPDNLSHVQCNIIKHVAHWKDPRVTSALAQVAGDERQEATIRLEAIEGIVKHEHPVDVSSIRGWLEPLEALDKVRSCDLLVRQTARIGARMDEAHEKDGPSDVPETEDLEK